MKYKNIIWDWNGTILNDTPVAVEATNILLQRLGYPTIKLCISICRVLGKTLDDLFWDEE